MCVLTTACNPTTFTSCSTLDLAIVKQPTLKLGSTSAPIYPRATSKSAASCDCSGVGAVVCDSQSTRVAVSHTASGKISSCLLSIESEWGQNGGGNLALLLVSLIGWRLLCMCKSECSSV